MSKLSAHVVDVQGRPRPCSGESGLDDDAYDRLLRAITAWEVEHPEQTAADSPTRQVAAGVTSGEVVALGELTAERTQWAAALCLAVQHPRALIAAGFERWSTVISEGGTGL